MDTLKLQENLFPLPSGGLAYGESNLLVGGDSVRIRPYLYGDQRYIESWRQSKNMHVFYKGIMDRILVEPRKFDLDQMLLTDVVAAMFAARLLAYGPGFSTEYTCPGCKLVQFPTIDLTAIKVRTYEDIDDYLAEGLTVELPDCGKVLTMHLPRLKDEKELHKTLTHMQNSGRLLNAEQDRHTARLCQMIDLIGGEVKPPPVKFQMFETMTYGDVRVIEDVLLDKDTGLLTTDLECTCKNCGFVVGAPLNIDLDFFRPPVVRK